MKPKCSSITWTTDLSSKLSWRLWPHYSPTNNYPKFTHIPKLKSLTILMLNITAQSVLEHPLNNSKSFSIQDHQTCGSPPNNADSLLPAIFTNTLTALRAPLMLRMVPISTLLTDQEPLLDILDKTQPQLPVWQLKTLFSVKSPSLKASALLLLSLTVF